MGQNGHFPASVHRLQERMYACGAEHQSTLTLLSRDWIRKNIAREANKHSVRIEYDGETRGKIRDRDLYDEMMRRQAIAWNYAIEHIAPEQKYTVKDLATIAQFLAPHSRYNPNSGFRMEDVLITGAPYPPPSPTKLEDEVKTLITRVESMPPLHKAIYSHYHLVRIHPFADGNGRTARVVQNAIMCGARSLPINIRREQRDLYLSLLAETDKRYYADDHEYLHMFSEFLVSNLKTSLRQANRHPLLRLLF